MQEGQKKNNDKDLSRYSLFAGYAAVVIVSILIISKALAYYFSGSASILSSLTDSIMDSMVSVMALASIYYARRPADNEHRWGHGKMEAISALFQSAAIMGGGVFLVFEAANRFVEPVEISHQLLGIGVMVLSILLSALLVSIQKNSLNKSPSLAVEADSAHYSSDILINAGVLLVLVLIYMGSPLWIDPLFALLVAGFLARISRNIGSKAIDVLMDRELPEEDRKRIAGIITANKKVLGMHDLRTRRNGRVDDISFDIEVDASLSLMEAHNIALDIEKDILKSYPHAEVLIHVDPEGQAQDARHSVKGVHH